MEDHDQRKNNPSSGHEGHHQVHHCHKCGWPFPNPHPSAKHRRAHRRICGTVEGYKLEESAHLNVSDDEHSDDDYKTPSAKALERSENEKGSGVFSTRSHQSEDEVFADAASNFADITSSTVAEAALENTLESESSVEKAKEDAPALSATAEFIQAADSTDSAAKQNLMVPATTADVLGSKPDTQDDFSSSPVGIIADSAEKSTTATTSSNLADNSDLNKPDPSVAMIEEAKKPGEDIAVPEFLSESISGDREVKVVEENNPSSHENNNVRATLEAILKLEETFETSIAMPLEDTKLAEENDLLSLDNNSARGTARATLKLEETVGTSNPIAPGDVKLAEETTPLSLDNNNANNTPEAIPKMEETHDSVAIPALLSELSREERVSSQVSLSGDTPQVELDVDQKSEVSTSSNVVHENDKGEENGKFQVFSVPHDVPIVENPESVVEGFKDHTRMGWFQPDNSGTSEGILEKVHAITCPPKSLSEALKEGSEISSDFQDPKEPSELEAGESKYGVEEAFIEGKLISHNERKGLTDFNTIKDDLTADSEQVSGKVNASSERELPGSTHELPGSSTEFLPCQTSAAASLNTHDESVDDKSKVEITHTAEVGEMEKHAKIEETEREGVLESASVMEKADIGEEDYINRDTEESLTENLKVPESAKNFHDVQVDLVSNPIIDDGTFSHGKQEKEKLVAEADATEAAGSVHGSCESENKSGGNIETVMVAQETVSVSLENLKEVEINEARLVEKVLAPLGTASLVQAPSTIGVGSDKNLGGPKSSSLQDECETDNVTQPVAGPTLDASVDSRSTDSLDANWGSVSVLSTQSDIAAIEDSKATASASNIPKSESEVTKSLDKSEVFEPPSFMTLVEPAGTGVKTTASPNQGGPGWFPSLTNVSTDSPGRKKNEEIIAKVTNWSSNQQPQSPLKSLLMEANRDAKPKSPNLRENMQAGAQEEKSVTVGSILGSETQKADKEKPATPQEWNSPARYPAEIKREKRKVKGRSYWAQFMCCSSVN